MFEATHYYAFVLLKFIVGFIIVIAHLNFSGKTQLSQMTPIDFIGNFVLGGIIGGVIYNDVIPMYQYILLLLIGVSFISILNWISRRFSLFRMVTIGRPIPIIKDGRFLMDNILSRQNKIDIMSVSSQLHTQGIHSFQQVHYAQIEPSGQLSVICEGDNMPSVIIMQSGKVSVSGLETIEKEMDWLKARLAEAAIDPDDVFLAEFWQGKLSFIMMNGDRKP